MTMFPDYVHHVGAEIGAEELHRKGAKNNAGTTPLKYSFELVLDFFWGFQHDADEAIDVVKLSPAWTHCLSGFRVSTPVA